MTPAPLSPPSSTAAALLPALADHPLDATPRGMLRDCLMGDGCWDWPTVRDLVIDRPECDGRRLLAAQWFEDEGEADRAEFVRVQVAVSRTPHNHRHRDFGGPPDGCEACRLQKRGRKLFEQSPQTHGWFGAAFNVLMLGSDWWQHLGWFRRGFIEAVSARAESWLAHADAILAGHPVREVTLTTEPDYDYEIKPSGVTARIRFRGEEWWVSADPRRPETESLRGLLAYRWPRVKVWNLPRAAVDHRRQAAEVLDRFQRDFPLAVPPDPVAGDFPSFTDEALLTWAEYHQPVSRRVMDELRRRGLVDWDGRRIDTPATT